MSPVDLAFWEAHYQEGDTAWNLNEPAPPFVAFLKNRKEALPTSTLAVVGSGHGHDAALFGQAGYTVTGFDLSPTATKMATTRYGQWGNFVTADLFQLPQTYTHGFDAVVEHTCFCAISPQQRQAYVAAVHQMLKPEGRFLGLFFAHLNWGGPPYRVSRQEIISLFSPYFELTELYRTPESHPKRANQEYLGLFTKKN